MLVKTVLGVLFIVKNNELFDKAKKLKGYGSFLKSENKKNIEKIVTLKTGLKVKPTVIKTLREYFDFISQLETSYQNPVFYRGQTNATTRTIAAVSMPIIIFLFLSIFPILFSIL